MQHWQNRWDDLQQKAQWTKEPNISECINRKHGEVNYNVTQILSSIF